MRRPTHTPLWLIAAAVAFGLVLLFPQWRLDPPEYNDGVLHEGMAEYAAQHWQEQWPVDFWYPSVSAGFPMFAYYPSLSHLTAAALAHWGRLDARRVYITLWSVLLALLPLSIFVSLRRLGFTEGTSASAALLYPLITAGYYGIGWRSYLASGYGLAPQLWGVFFFFPTLAWGYDAVRTGRCYAAGLLLAVCTLSHFLYGYMAALSLGMLLLLPDPAVPWRRRLERLLRMAAVMALATAYFVIPFLLNKGQLLMSRWEPRWKWNSMGWQWVLPRLLRGEIFDWTPVPVITALVAIGVVVAVRKAIGGDRGQRWLLACFALWLVLLCGRASLGAVTDVLPLAAGLHMHRFIGGVQAFGLVLAGGGLAAVWGWLRRQLGTVRYGPAIAAVLLGALIAVPAVRQIGYVRNGDVWAADAKDALAQAWDFHELVGILHGLPPGRVHAGFAGTWGKKFDIGGIPVYVHLQRAGFDMVGYLFMAMARPGEWQVRLDYRRQDHCDLYDLRYILAPRSMPMPPFAALRAEAGDIRLYEVPTSGYFALGTVVAPQPGQTALADAPWEDIYQRGDNWLQGPEPARHRFLALDDSGVAQPADDSASVRGTLSQEQVAPGSYRCHVVVEDAADLILKVTYHPYWEALVDGQPTGVHPVIPGFMAIALRPGAHDVRFTYRPPVWKKALFALSLTMLLAGMLAGGWKVLRPRSAPVS
jgi:hypothetical protein